MMGERNNSDEKSIILSILLIFIDLTLMLIFSRSVSSSTLSSVANFSLSTTYITVPSSIANTTLSSIKTLAYSTS